MQKAIQTGWRCRGPADRTKLLPPLTNQLHANEKAARNKWPSRRAYAPVIETGKRGKCLIERGYTIIARNRAMRACRGGCVESRFTKLAPLPRNGFTMKRCAVAGPANS